MVHTTNMLIVHDLTEVTNQIGCTYKRQILIRHGEFQKKLESAKL